MNSLISFIVVLGVLIFVHELGHFLFAKLFGVRVLKFSVGFGNKVVGKKWGDTEYLLSAFPLGGYVKMFGEQPGDEISEQEKGVSFSMAGVALMVSVFPSRSITRWICSPPESLINSET